jgi:dTMP kinase
MKGYFITFEGLEGAGKSTQARMLCQKLTNEGYPCVLTAEPGGTALGEALKSIIIDTKYKDMVPLAELYLFSAARAQHVEKVIRPSIEEGKIVICDRFFDATIAYQSFGRGLPETLVRETNSRASWNVRPDITFFLDIEPAKGLSRVSQRLQELEQPADRIEKEDFSFFERVREGYLYISREEPMRFRVLDADVEPFELSHKLYDLIDKELGRIKFKKEYKISLPLEMD